MSIEEDIEIDNLRQERLDEIAKQALYDEKNKINYFVTYRKWHHTEGFCRAGETFDNNGAYCSYPAGSIAYTEFWDQEEFRIKNGYEWKGQRIAGLHYLYLNYCPIWNKARRKFAFPDFRAADAEWFLAIEKDLGLAHYNNDPTRPMGHVDGKTRQCGHSLKGCVPLLFYMNFIRGAKCFLGAIEDKYAVKTLKMYLKYHDHLYRYTDLGKGWLEKTKNKYYKTGFIEKVNGVEVEAGYQSELSIITFQDTTEKGVGGGCDLFVIEEAGLFPEVLDAIDYISNACKDGDNTTGNILVFGAAGKLENCKQYEKLCMDPERYGFAGYPNLYEKGKQDQKVAYMIPNYSCRPPYMDTDGNPDCEAAIKARDRAFANLKKKDFKRWAQKISQEPNNLREMFDLRGHTRFKKEIIEPHLAFLKAHQESMGTRVHLYTDHENVAKYSLTVEDDRQPIIEYPHEGTNTEGCPLIYEFPPHSPPRGLFIAGIDSYNQDDSTTTSLGSMFIYKQANSLSGETGGRYIVAEIVCRPKLGKKEFYRQCAILLRLYNAVAMVENEDPEIVSWFHNQGLSEYLADQPDIIRNIIPNSKVKRTKGIHAAPALIIAAENKIQSYLEERIGWIQKDSGEMVEKLGVTRITSIGLLEELLRYVSDDGDNYDRERSFGWLLMYEEEIYTHPIEEQVDDHIAQFLTGVPDMAEKDYRSRHRGHAMTMAR